MKELLVDGHKFFLAEDVHKKMIPKMEGCRGHWSGHDPRDFGCDYPYSARMTCEECIFGVCNGTKDPRKEYDEEMIPRPSEEAARKAVDELIRACDNLGFYTALGAFKRTEAEDERAQKAKAALLRLMGVEV